MAWNEQNHCFSLPPSLYVRVDWFCWVPVADVDRSWSGRCLNGCAPALIATITVGKKSRNRELHESLAELTHL